jgi:hypothetical protein
MQAVHEFGFQQLITELRRGLADTVTDRPGETEAQRFARHQTAVFSVMQSCRAGLHSDDLIGSSRLIGEWCPSLMCSLTGPSGYGTSLKNRRG